MTRNYSPNHPAVRSWNGDRPLTVRERTAAVRARRGIRHRDGKTGDRIVIGSSAFILAIGITEAYPAIGLALAGVAVACAWPWVRDTIEEVRSWR